MIFILPCCCRDTCYWDQMISINVLKSHIIYQQQFEEEECSIRYDGEYNYVIEFEDEDCRDTLTCPEGSVEYYDNCYILTESTTFVNTRELCLNMGGELSIYHLDNINPIIDSDTYWILGVSMESKPILPMIPSSHLSPIYSDNYELKAPDPSSELHLPGLCVVPKHIVGTNIVDTLDIQNAAFCDDNKCSGNGICYVLMNQDFMCDCDIGYYGPICDTTGIRYISII